MLTSFDLLILYVQNIHFSCGLLRLQFCQIETFPSYFDLQTTRRLDWQRFFIVRLLIVYCLDFCVQVVLFRSKQEENDQWRYPRWSGCFGFLRLKWVALSSTRVICKTGIIKFWEGITKCIVKFFKKILFSNTLRLKSDFIVLNNTICTVPYSLNGWTDFDKN